MKERGISIHYFSPRKFWRPKAKETNKPKIAIFPQFLTLKARIAGKGCTAQDLSAQKSPFSLSFWHSKPGSPQRVHRPKVVCTKISIFPQFLTLKARIAAKGSPPKSCLHKNRHFPSVFDTQSPDRRKGLRRPKVVCTKIVIFPQFLTLKARIAAEGCRPESCLIKNRNFPSVFDTQSRIAAKGCRPESCLHKNRHFPSVFDTQSPDRRKGSPCAPKNRNFPSVFDTQSPDRRKGLPKKNAR